MKSKIKSNYEDLENPGFYRNRIKEALDEYKEKYLDKYHKNIMMCFEIDGEYYAFDNNLKIRNIDTFTELEKTIKKCYIFMGSHFDKFHPIEVEIFDKSFYASYVAFEPDLYFKFHGNFFISDKYSQKYGEYVSNPLERFKAKWDKDYEIN